MTKKIARVLLVLFVGLFWVIRLLDSSQIEDSMTPEVAMSCDEWEEMDSVSLNKLHHRNWLEYTWNDTFCASYVASNEKIERAAFDRTNYQIPDWQSDNEFWGQVYEMLYQHDRHDLTALQDSLRTIGNDTQMDRDEFARMVVAFVQDIPYNYVMPEGCEGYDKHPCIPNERFGIFSPVEFLYRLQGDCDTRTVLLFTLLSNFGYDPIIVNSSEYGHSMLALDITTSGDYILYQGKRYAFWETTNVGWLPGMIPPDMQNKDYWDVVLSNRSL